MDGYALIICNCENLFSAERDGPILQSVSKTMGFETTHVRYLKPSRPHPGETIHTLQEFKDLATRFTTEVNKRGRGFLSLSSHGYSGLKCTDGSDQDGRDEYIRVFGQVVRDGDLRKWFLEPIEEGKTVFILVDTCHSGTMFDLPWFVNQNHKLEMENQLPLRADIWCFSACDDRQSAMDDIGERGYSGGLVAAVSDWVLANPVCKQPLRELVGSMYPGLRSRMAALGQTMYLSVSQPDSFNAPSFSREIFSEVHAEIRQLEYSEFGFVPSYLINGDQHMPIIVAYQCSENVNRKPPPKIGVFEVFVRSGFSILDSSEDVIYSSPTKKPDNGRRIPDMKKALENLVRSHSFSDISCWMEAEPNLTSIEYLYRDGNPSCPVIVLDFIDLNIVSAGSFLPPDQLMIDGNRFDIVRRKGGYGGFLSSSPKPVLNISSVRMDVINPQSPETVRKNDSKLTTRGSNESGGWWIIIIIIGLVIGFIIILKR